MKMAFEIKRQGIEIGIIDKAIKIASNPIDDTIKMSYDSLARLLMQFKEKGELPVLVSWWEAPAFRLYRTKTPFEMIGIDMADTLGQCLVSRCASNGMIQIGFGRNNGEKKAKALAYPEWLCAGSDERIRKFNTEHYCFEELLSKSFVDSPFLTAFKGKCKYSYSEMYLIAGEKDCRKQLEEWGIMNTKGSIVRQRIGGIENSKDNKSGLWKKQYADRTDMLLKSIIA